MASCPPRRTFVDRSRPAECDAVVVEAAVRLDLGDPAGTNVTSPRSTRRTFPSSAGATTDEWSRSSVEGTRST